jgi:hypothetical protein
MRECRTWDWIGINSSSAPYLLLLLLSGCLPCTDGSVTQPTNTIPPPDSFVSVRILPLLPAPLKSPVLTDVTWTALVHSATQPDITAFTGGLRVGV